MASRQALLTSVTSPARLQAAHLQQQAFDAFRQGLGIEESPEALILYLTWLLDADHLSGKTLRRQLSLLDLTRRLAGQPEWRTGPDVRQFLRGVHRDHSLGPTIEHSDPVYRETLHAFVDAVMLPARDQVRDRAIILVANETPWPASCLARLRWDDVRFYGNRVEIYLPPPRRPQHRYPEHVTILARGDDLCAVAALRHLRASAQAQDELVFASRFGVCHRGTFEDLVARLPRKPGPQYPIRFRTGGTPLRRILTATTAACPLQLRDRALLLMGHGAALRGYQAIDLRQSQVTATAAGLVLEVSGRDHLVGIPACEQPEYCPTRAWTQWLQVLTAQRLNDPAAPAFFQGRQRALLPVPMTHESLTAVVQEAAEAAQLTGHYTFASLRIGFVRTSIRAGAPEHTVAAHSGFRYLHSVQRHSRREQIIRTSVAGQLGL